MVQQNTVRQGSGVYCGGVALTVISMTLVVARRNGFRATNMTLGDTIQHRGVDVWFSRKALVIGGGKVVNVYSPADVWSTSSREERYTVHSPRETHYRTGLSQLVGHGFGYINGKVEFVDLWTALDGTTARHSKHDGEFWGYTVCKVGTRQPIGHYEW